jgi:N-acyl-D-amino-acid deacylase
MDMDTASTLISRATVVDGTGAPGRDADVVLEAGRIRAIARPGSLDPSEHLEHFEAAGLVLTPGFIDMHAHSDLQVLLTPEHTAKLSQGVTTEVLGQDGLSYAPITPEVLAVVRQKIAGWNDDPRDREIGWPTVRAYLDELDTAGIAANVAYLVPHGVVRAQVMGFDEGAADAEQIGRMCAILEQGLLDGAAGMSTGLTYTPGMYADRAELAALCGVLARHDGYLSPHTRSYGHGALEAYAEMIDLAEVSGCALHLTHATMNFGENEGRGGELLELVDAALARGVDITLDTYPYLPGATMLSAVLPSWAAAGDTEAILARFQDPADRARIREDMEINGSDGCHGVTVEYETLEISGVRNPELAGLVGRTVQEIAEETGEEPFDTALRIMAADRLGTGILQHVGHEENVRTIMAHPAHTGGSDGILIGAKPHPRAWGTFPRFLGHYVRDEKLMSLEEMVHHLSGRPAQRLRLRERGEIREGWAADLVLLDPSTVDAASTFAEPRQPARGIRAVWVNGALAYGEDGATGRRAGRALRGEVESPHPLSPRVAEHGPHR